MYGRYGMDRLGKLLTWGAVVILIVAMLTGLTWLDIVALVVLIYGYFRMFSRNINARYNENAKYLSILGKVKWFFKSRTDHMKQRKTHHIYSCPQCRQKIRVPKGKGKIAIRCPKCGNEFVKVS